MSAINPKDPRTWPVDPASSKGERIPDPPTPDTRLAERDKWTALLPKPPQPLYGQDERSIHAWLAAVGEVGGMEGVRFAWNPENFPFGSYMRGRCGHLYQAVLKDLEELAKFRAEQEIRKRGKEQEDTHRNLMRERGWT